MGSKWEKLIFCVFCILMITPIFISSLKESKTCKTDKEFLFLLVENAYLEGYKAKLLKKDRELNFAKLKVEYSIKFDKICEK